MFFFLAMFLKSPIDQNSFPGLDQLIDFPFVLESDNDDDKFSLQLEDDFIDLLDES